MRSFALKTLLYRARLISPGLIIMLKMSPIFGVILTRTGKRDECPFPRPQHLAVPALNQWGSFLLKLSFLGSHWSQPASPRRDSLPTLVLPPGAPLPNLGLNESNERRNSHDEVCLVWKLFWNLRLSYLVSVSRNKYGRIALSTYRYTVASRLQKRQ